MIRVIVNGANCARFVRECIRSIQSQQVEFKAYVVDDGSTDATYERVLDYCANDPRFTIYRKAVNEGAAAARWHVLSRLKPSDEDIIVLVDLDDRLESNALWHVEQAHTVADVTYGSCKTASGKYLGSPYPKEVVEAKSYRNNKWVCFPLRTFKWKVFARCNFSADSFKYSKDITVKGETIARKGEWYKVCTDVALMHPVLENAENPKFIAHPLYFYNDIGNHIGRAKYPIELWSETNKQINAQTSKGVL